MQMPYMAGRVRGHARVTGVVPATSDRPYTLFASPLYVQFGAPPSKPGSTDDLAWWWRGRW
jgi:hypothetical protein